MKIAIGCDHGGIVLKPAVIKALTELGAEVVDLGTYDESSVDYPVYGIDIRIGGRFGRLRRRRAHVRHRHRHLHFRE